MIKDRSSGYEAIAETFRAVRSEVGVDVVRRWAGHLPKGGAVVDIGCGTGVPVAQALVEEGLVVSGVDASPTLMSEFRRRFPTSPWACEPAETSDFFDRSFDGAVAIGLLFLLPEAAQRRVMLRVSEHLQPGGRFLFSAPQTACAWNDALTDRPSLSLGAEAYDDILRSTGMHIEGEDLDEGDNHYFDAVKA